MGVTETLPPQPGAFGLYPASPSQQPTCPRHAGAAGPRREQKPRVFQRETRRGGGGSGLHGGSRLQGGASTYRAGGAATPCVVDCTPASGPCVVRCTFGSENGATVRWTAHSGQTRRGPLTHILPGVLTLKCAARAGRKASHTVRI